MTPGASWVHPGATWMAYASQLHQSVNQSIHQSLRLSINQSIDQSTNQSMNLNQPIHESGNQAISFQVSPRWSKNVFLGASLGSPLLHARSTHYQCMQLSISVHVCRMEDTLGVPLKGMLSLPILPVDMDGWEKLLCHSHCRWRCIPGLKSVQSKKKLVEPRAWLDIC